jgi:putative transposase
MSPVSELAFLGEATGDEMKRKRFTEEQIIGILKEAEASGNIREVCRLHNLTETTFYRWRNKFGGMDVSEARRLKELERENAELKRIVADLTLDIRMLKDVNSKKW